jgi:hypothetical protein
MAEPDEEPQTQVERRNLSKPRPKLRVCLRLYESCYVQTCVGLVVVSGVPDGLIWYAYQRPTTAYRQ